MSRRKLKPGQKRYSVGGLITISVHTEVNAISPAEARELAEKRGLQSLCHHCSRGEPHAEWVTSGELDGDTPAPYEGETELNVTELED